MAYSVNDLVLESFSIDEFTFTYFITGNPSATDIVGKAVALDTTQRGSVHLAADGEQVFGRIFQYEDRTQQGGGKVVTVERKFRKRLPKGTGTTVAIGDNVVGAGAGLVRTGAAVAGSGGCTVIDVSTDYVVVEKF
jgi:hypothetical protein